MDFHENDNSVSFYGEKISLSLAKLHDVFNKKCDDLANQPNLRSVYPTWKAAFKDIISKLGVRQVDKNELLGDCDRFSGCILVYDPSEFQIGNRYLVMSKDVAEKVLAVGIG
jgi:hypothetical protein